MNSIFPKTLSLILLFIFSFSSSSQAKFIFCSVQGTRPMKVIEISAARNSNKVEVSLSDGTLSAEKWALDIQKDSAALQVVQAAFLKNAEICIERSSGKQLLTIFKED